MHSLNSPGGLNSLSVPQQFTWYQQSAQHASMAANLKLLASC